MAAERSRGVPRAFRKTKLNKSESVKSVVLFGSLRVVCGAIIRISDDVNEKYLFVFFLFLFGMIVTARLNKQYREEMWPLLFQERRWWMGFYLLATLWFISSYYWGINRTGMGGRRSRLFTESEHGTRIRDHFKLYAIPLLHRNIPPPITHWTHTHIAAI